MFGQNFITIHPMLVEILCTGSNVVEWSTSISVCKYVSAEVLDAGKVLSITRLYKVIGQVFRGVKVSKPGLNFQLELQQKWLPGEAESLICIVIAFCSSQLLYHITLYISFFCGFRTNVCKHTKSNPEEVCLMAIMVLQHFRLPSITTAERCAKCIFMYMQ